MRKNTIAAALAVAAVALAAGHAEAAKRKKAQEPQSQQEVVAPPSAPVDPWTVADAAPEFRETSKQKLDGFQSEARGEVVLAGQVVGAYRLLARPYVPGNAGKAPITSEFPRFAAALTGAEADYDVVIDTPPTGCNRLSHAVAPGAEPRAVLVAWSGGGSHTSMPQAQESWGLAVTTVELRGGAPERMTEVGKALIGGCAFAQ